MQLEMEELKNQLTKSNQPEITTSYIEDEIDILDEINEVAVVKTLSKSTSKDKSKKYKSFKEN
jgi:hypothetical protein